MDAYAALKITDAHGCPHCGAITGNSCTTSTGNPCPPHVLRVNMAKRAAVRGNVDCGVDCPAGCGGSLTLTQDGRVLHIGTWTFECGA